MRKVYSQELVNDAVSRSEYESILRALEVPLFLVRYETGESISSPWEETLYFQVVVTGTLSIYYMREDGSSYSLSTGGPGYLIGDVDLFVTQRANVYAEAMSDLTMIAVDVKQHRAELMANNAFLQFLSMNMARKISMIMRNDAVFSTLSDRVLNYMHYLCENQTLAGLERTAFKLHCSARQLQRIMNELVEQGRVEKTGKGKYRLLPQKEE